MTKGIIYIMTTAITGLIKIGSTNDYQERMRFLENNGYRNATGLKSFFAIELNDYKEKEKLLKEIFSEHIVGDSELFALDYDLVKALLLAFEGKVVFPENINREKEFDKISDVREKNNLFSFYKKGMKNGDIIVFAKDKNITAKVAGEKEVEFEDQTMKLSPLTYMIFERKGQLNASGAYQGANYFEFNGVKLKNLPNIVE